VNTLATPLPAANATRSAPIPESLRESPLGVNSWISGSVSIDQLFEPVFNVVFGAELVDESDLGGVAAEVDPRFRLPDRLRVHVSALADRLDELLVVAVDDPLQVLAFVLLDLPQGTPASLYSPAVNCS